MYDFCIKWVAKISTEGQANGLPQEIYAYSFVIDSNPNDAKTQIAWLIEHEMNRFAKNGGLPVEVIPAKLTDFTRLDPNRKIVPMNWIVELAPIPRFIGDYVKDNHSQDKRH